jgi:hypothetical protein
MNFTSGSGEQFGRTWVWVPGFDVFCNQDRWSVSDIAGGVSLYSQNIREAAMLQDPNSHFAESCYFCGVIYGSKYHYT